MKQITMDGINIELEKKRIKNMYLRVLPPDGRVHVTAPVRMKDEYINSFIRQKLDWIRKQQLRLQSSQSFRSLRFESGETIFYKGRKYVLLVKETAGRPGITVHDTWIEMNVRESNTPEQRKKLLDRWYREALVGDIGPLMERWMSTIGVEASGYTIRDMKTRWGTCNVKTRKVCFNLQLAKKPSECLEYVVVHELVHLLERSHNRVFQGYMDKFLPKWRTIRKELNTME